MPLIKRKPVTKSMRFTILGDYRSLGENKPERSLIRKRKQKAGRNSAGRVTIRHRGGGHKRKMRVIDFRREKFGIPAKIARLEYDPNRSSHIALLNYVDGEKRYILAAVGMQEGQMVVSGPAVDPAIGNALPLSAIPLGVMVHNIEMYAGRGGQMIRTAGSGATLMSRANGYANLRMPSGEIRLVKENCYATIGQVSNPEHDGESLGKAGRKRWMGIRPTVRGVAMNPVDHPMGGGEGRTSGGGHPVSPWGKLAKGKKTRARNKPTNKFILQKRKK